MKSTSSSKTISSRTNSLTGVSVVPRIAVMHGTPNITQMRWFGNHNGIVTARNDCPPQGERPDLAAPAELLFGGVHFDDIIHKIPVALMHFPFRLNCLHPEHLQQQHRDFALPILEQLRNSCVIHYGSAWSIAVCTMCMASQESSNCPS